jgi:hypothetical protein
MIVISRLGNDDLSGAAFVGSMFPSGGPYTFGARLLAAIVDWIPFVVTAGIAYRFKFGDRSSLPILVWIGGAYLLCPLTRVLFVFALIFG